MTARVAAGVREGGQFAHHARAEAAIGLATGADPVLGTNPPVIEFDELHHVGTLDVADRKVDSYEGDGLSVSLHPDDWAEIADLPGATWTLTRSDGAPLRLVSWHDLDEAARERVRAWGVAQGWVTPEPVAVLRYFDSEYEQWMSSEFPTREEAEAEAEFCEYDASEITDATSWHATAAFPGRVVAGVDCTDVLLAAYVRAERPDLDGVWWDDEYDPVVLSCPRGVLVHDLDAYEATCRG